MTLIVDPPTSDGSNWASASSLILDGLKSLDPTVAEQDLAISRYEGIGVELDEIWSATRGANRVFPQGSFRLGTVTRRVNGDIDIDIDCVALRDIDRSSITQEELKEEVGRAVRAYARRPDAGGPIVTESDRCWTLSWPGMHLDVLPAVPSGPFVEGLLITDKSVRAWQRSNPEGYASWFHRQMAVEFLEEETRLAKALQVDHVPAWSVKTSLQRSVQALKRHRDLYFIDRPERRPASIVITTLAARAYSGGGDLLSVLRDITRLMPSFIEYEDGRWSLPNPVEPDENFTDYWASDPSRPKFFFEWMVAAQRDFVGLNGLAGLDAMAIKLEKAFGASVSQAAMASAASKLDAARNTRTVSIAAGTAALTLGATAIAAPAHAAKPNTFYGGSSN